MHNMSKLGKCKTKLNDFCGNNPDRAPLKEVLGGQYTYREGEGKCCSRALIKAAG